MPSGFRRVSSDETGQEKSLVVVPGVILKGDYVLFQNGVCYVVHDRRDLESGGFLRPKKDDLSQLH